MIILDMDFHEAATVVEGDMMVFKVFRLRYNHGMRSRFMCLVKREGEGGR